MCTCFPSCGLLLGDTSRPPRTLLEGSSRRVARDLAASIEAQQKEVQASNFMTCKAFTDAYVKALETNDFKWASHSIVSSLFHKNAKLATQDKQSFTGLAAVIRRLNTGNFGSTTTLSVKCVDPSTPHGSEKKQLSYRNSCFDSNTRFYATGVEQLCKMTSQNGVRNDSSTSQKEMSKMITISDPVEKATGVWITTYSVSWGIRRYEFQDEFTFQENTIKKLKRSQV